MKRTNKPLKTKLLKKLRRIGRNQIEVISVTTTDGTITGMSYSYSPGDEKLYEDLFSFGDSKERVYDKAARAYMKANLPSFRKKYKRYSCTSK